MKPSRRFGAALALMFLWSGLAGAQPAARSEPPSFELPDRFFPILSWDLPHWSDGSFSSADHGLASLADCGFTTAAFVRPHHLPKAQELGLKCLVAAEHFPIPWATMSDEQIEKTARELIGTSAGNPAVLGYFLADEPGVQDFPALGKAVAAVKRLAPGKLAYINLFPDYATLGAPNLSQLGTASYADYLEQFVGQVKPQFISYDNYQIQYSNDQKNPAVAASYYRNLLAVRRVAMEHDLPFWNIVSSNQIRPDMPAPSPANLLLQAYTTLAAGGKGLTWYTYYATGYAYAPVDQDGRRTLTWTYLKLVNDQVKVLGPIMRPLKCTGVYFTDPAPAPSLAALPGTLVTAARSDLPLMIGEFTGSADEKYAMVVNLSLRDSAHVTMTLADSIADAKQVSPADGSPLPLEPHNAARLPAGQGILLRLTPRH